MEKELGVERQTATLKSGVPLISYFKQGAPVSVKVVFLSGARFEPEDKPGLAHFSEHMVVSGTEKFPSKDGLALYFDRFGGSYNAMTSAEWMALTYSLADADDFSHVCTMLDQCLNHSLVDPDVFATEQGAVVQELAMSTSSPQRAVGKEFFKLLYQGTPLETNILGTEESIRAFTAKDVRQFFANRLSPDRMTVVVAGGVAASEAARQIDKQVKLADVKVHITQQKPKPLPVNRQHKIGIAHFNDNSNLEVLLGFRTTPLNHNDNNALYVAHKILGVPRIGRLFKRLRMDKGLVYSVGAGGSRFSDAGASYIGTSCKKTDLEEVLKITGEELARLASEPIAKTELDFIVDRESKAMKIGLQTAGSWVGSFAIEELLGVAKSLDEDMADLRAVTPGDVQRVAAKYFTNDNWYLALAGNVQEDEVLFQI